MAPAWPRNIVPYTEQALRALSTVESVALYEAALDRPLREDDLTAQQAKLVAELVDAELLERRDGLLVPTVRHRREPDEDAPFNKEHKLAVVGYAQQIMTETTKALETRGARAQAALGVVTLPERPEIVARAVGIMAEAEDQLRALAEEEASDTRGPKMRVYVFLGSTS